MNLTRDFIMKKILKYLLYFLLLVVLIVVIAAVIAWMLGDRKAQRRVDVQPAAVAFVTDAEALARGKHLFETRNCMECHGANGAGRAVVDDAKSGFLVQAPNITPSAGSAVAKYTEVDWVRAIRHGVSPAGHALFVMPSEDFNRLSDQDLAALVAYIRSLAPVEGMAAEIRMPFLIKALYGFGLIRDAAEKIDHSLPPTPAQVPQPTREYGAYLVNGCIGCHGAHLSGGQIPGAPPEWPPAANLTPGSHSAMVQYDTVDKFKAMMRTGKRPDGSTVSPVMPFMGLKLMDDVELEALYLHLKGLAARDGGTR